MPRSSCRRPRLSLPLIAAAVIVATSTTTTTASAECPFLRSALGDEYNNRTKDLLTLVLGDSINAPLFSASPEQLEQQQRDLRRYDHYKQGSASKYEHYTDNKYYSTTQLSDIWLCMACAVGWCVWMLSATRRQEIEPSVYESHESKTIWGNVLEVTLGEDPDGTGIPIYHTLVDYVVETSNPTTERTDPDQEPQTPPLMQVRKCFSTTILLEEGFANVPVLVLLDDPTTSILWEDFVHERNQRNKQQSEPPDIFYSAIVYIVAAVLILTSLVGAVHAYVKLDLSSSTALPNQALWGKISLGVGTALIYPLAWLLYHLLNWGYRWVGPLVQRPGVIIHGAQRSWHKTCGATLNPLEVMGGNTFDTSDIHTSATAAGMSSPVNSSSKRMAATATSPKYKTPQQQQRHKATVLSSVLEMSHVSSSSTTGNTSNDDHGMVRKQHTLFKPKSPRTPTTLYPNAGCGFGNFNVLMPTPPKMFSPASASGGGTAGNNHNKDCCDLSAISVSSMSSGGTGSTKTARLKPSMRRSDDEHAASGVVRPRSSDDSLLSADDHHYVPPTMLLQLPPHLNKTTNGEPPTTTTSSSAPTPLASNVVKPQTASSAVVVGLETTNEEVTTFEETKTQQHNKVE